MAKSSKSGFVIKLSSETVQKLTEEEQQVKKQADEAAAAKSLENADSQNIAKHVVECDETSSADKAEKPADTQLSVDKKSATTEKSVAVDPVEASTKVNSTENKEGGKTESKEDVKGESSADTSWGDYAPYITYEGEEAIYTDPSNQQKYTWDQKTNAWNPKAGSEVPGRVYSYENDTHIYTEADGSKSFWDDEKKAWIPKVDDDFLAYYQMSYGFVDNTAKEGEESKNKEKEKPQKEQNSGVKRKSEPQWFDASDENNTKVYVSNLPLELTEEEFVDFMQKCGLVERDPRSQKMKVKLYMDKEQNCFKGDALCTYIKIESVDLALKLLDGGDLKGNKVKVERASFQLKGEYNPALKPKKKKKKELEKLKKMQQKLFDWRPEKFVGERSKHERIVIVKNLFHPTDFDADVQLILDYQQDMREEATKCGEVRKVVIYDRHPEGVAQITMKEPEQADAVVALMNGRWFGKRQITAEIWDGRTKYRIAETDADLSKRVDKWDKFLEGKEGDESKQKTEESATTAASDETKSGEIATAEVSAAKEADLSKNIDKLDGEESDKSQEKTKTEEIATEDVPEAMES